MKCGECRYEHANGLGYCDGCRAKLAAGSSAPRLRFRRAANPMVRARGENTMRAVSDYA